MKPTRPTVQCCSSRVWQSGKATAKAEDPVSRITDTRCAGVPVQSLSQAPSQHVTCPSVQAGKGQALTNVDRGFVGNDGFAMTVRQGRQRDEMPMQRQEVFKIRLRTPYNGGEQGDPWKDHAWRLLARDG